VLAFVTDVRAEDILDDDGDEIGFKIVFKFQENPFLTDTELSVTYHISEDEGYMTVRDIEGCEVHWRPDKDVTVKKMRKKPKPGAKNKAPQTKLEPVESFFRWFTDAPEVPDNLDDPEADEDEDLDDLREEVERHMGIGEVLREQVVPHAVKWFTGQALLEMEEDEDEEDDDEDIDEDFDEDDSEDDDGDEDLDDDEDDSGDEGAPGIPKDSKEQPAECKQQ